MKQPELYIGVMSGTSMDGVDTALVQIDGENVHMIAHDEYPMPSDIKSRLLNIATGQRTNLIEIGELDHQLGRLFADAVNALLDKSGYQADHIAAIGNHGQTVFHQPTSDFPFTMQLGDANIIAAQCGIDTVADFRRKDMALGGQGAPLVPAFHQAIFSATHSSVVVLNIGGISNISVLRPNQKVIGYDTGPGNMLMDAWCQKHRNRPYDKDAEFAYQGNVEPSLLSELLAESYLQKPPPKSTGRELFNLDWLTKHLADHYVPAEDVQRTLCEYTALTICEQVRLYKVGLSPELLVCGGGAQNPLLMMRLAELLPDWQVASTSEKGVDGDFMEAIAFAWLAQRRLHGLSSNLPEVTGASKLASLGVIYPSN
ncbi:anhydro-N-acetylmuramic acid kinase [Vibrio genomosp. F10]|uniref:Anhydro-N-acetylmuramic acid kinase n=2 Tax=Vibrio genomosp. F10 TaxID=723171 RepID=A0A1E5BJN9_9VIBR|nr:anhydro-N-acetylmuramic acid kinase [Vibrio genomosp. F10]OEE37876.1 anhydro-N-acetylmuramic acid kinase [Vibrio genomosp. F10 str. ZF-129]OEE93347.1 anhydro-N-acetylmuramic acid kinase [Vibrio genomosp. F10 str. 9ZC157]OEF10259.1 anhydro-N-acetylmuramic acid kinase [Vibrio genomosp. F10 str. 9ZB36]